VIVTRLPKYACRSCEGGIIQVPAPAHVIPGGMPTEGTIAHVLVSKYADHLPLYRQAQIYSRQGIDLDRSTLAAWVRYIYDFGDSWEHKLEIGQITVPVPGNLYPRLTDIAGRCPPEDVGGFPGYEEFLEAMADPKHPEHAHLKEWYGGTFDPKTTPTDELRFEVLRLARRLKPKKAVN